MRDAGAQPQGRTGSTTWSAPTPSANSPVEPAAGHQQRSNREAMTRDQFAMYFGQRASRHD
jgi:hypothetical protein